MAKSKWKPLISQFLKDRGTPATPAYIAEYFGRPQGDSNIARALKALTAQGVVIRTERKGLRDKPVWYEWNKDWKPWYVGDSMDTTRAIREGQYEGIAPGMEKALESKDGIHWDDAKQSKFTLGSEWRTRGGEKATVVDDYGMGGFSAIIGNTKQPYYNSGEWRGSKSESHFDLIAPWSEPKPRSDEQSSSPTPFGLNEKALNDSILRLEGMIEPRERLASTLPKPEEKSELRGFYGRYKTDGNISRNAMFEAIITAIEQLQKLVSYPDNLTITGDPKAVINLKEKPIDASKRSGGGEKVNIFISPDGELFFSRFQNVMFAKHSHLSSPIAVTTTMPWVEGEGL